MSSLNGLLIIDFLHHSVKNDRYSFKPFIMPPPQMQFDVDMTFFAHKQHIKIKINAYGLTIKYSEAGGKMGNYLFQNTKLSLFIS